MLLWLWTLHVYVDRQSLNKVMVLSLGMLSASFIYPKLGVAPVSSRHSSEF